MAKKSRKAQKRKKPKANISSIAEHVRERKKLIPPFSRLNNITFSSWLDNRLPEVLWAALIIGNTDRNECLNHFRGILSAGQSLANKDSFSVKHSDIAKIDDATFDSIFLPLLQKSEIKTILSGLLLFNTLPDRHHWVRHLVVEDPDVGIEYISTAVARTTDHQSQESTDCRWLIIMSFIIAGRAQFPEAFKEKLYEIIEYPNRGDMRSVRPSIRSMEQAFSNPAPGESFENWSDSFWQECWDNTNCVPAHHKEPEDESESPIAERLAEVYQLAASHFISTTASTKLNPKHDAVFGLVLYGINISLQLNVGSSHRRVEGRLAIRTLVETYITLAFLLKRDEEALWSKYRTYGHGQAKLAFLKMLELQEDQVPAYIRMDELELMANDDVWQEFTTIDLGHWANGDLRRMSQEADVKEIYDKYYGWPSGYVHSHWGAVRDTVFDLCLNPLHRYHRIPSIPKHHMGSVAEDSVRLVNLLLELLNKAYPSFKYRGKKDDPPAKPPTE